MTTEEAQKILDEMQGVRPEVLNDEAKRLFETIMKIVDERNLYKSMLEEKDKVIDLILDKFIEGTGNYFSEFDYMNKEEIKQYFENKAKECDIIK